VGARTGIVIVGHFDEGHVGRHLAAGGAGLGLAVERCDTRQAFSGSRWLRRMSWHLLGRRPPALRRFSEGVLRTCASARPAVLVATGLAPLTGAALRRLRHTGTVAVNYLTDDPWNPAHRGAWFLDALREYDHVFSTRRRNLAELARAGCRRVSYLPFAYAPEIHFPDGAGEAREDDDVVFVGGGDADRVPYIAALARQGMRVAVYGGYWERFRDVAHLARGFADARTARRAIAGARISLCLVRRANRDGHVMRTFEVPAMGGCMLLEDTDEHRELFGEDGAAVVYFRTIGEMVERARWLLAHEDDRRRLAARARQLVVDGAHTYRDRLLTMLRTAAAAGEPEAGRR